MNSRLMLERLKENVNGKSGCSVGYLKMLKSDIARLIKEYMDFTDIDFDIIQRGGAFEMNIAIIATEFFDIGRGG